MECVVHTVYTASAKVSLISPYLAAHWMLDTSDVMRKKIGITKYSFDKLENIRESGCILKTNGIPNLQPNQTTILADIKNFKKRKEKNCVAV